MDLALILPKTDRHEGAAEAFGQYWVRVRHRLPSYPPEVARQWLFDHPGTILDWSWLNLESLEFSKLSLTTRELTHSQFGDDGAIESFRCNFELRAGTCTHRFDRIAQYMQAHGTWPIAPLFLDNPDATAISPRNWKCAAPLQIIEGCHRLAVLRALAPKARLMARHVIWVATRASTPHEPQAAATDRAAEPCTFPVRS